MKMELQCPMPKMDFDIITLAHGSGGLLTHKLLKQGVFDLFKNPYLDKGHDGAFLKTQGNLAFTTDSYVITPVFFPDSNIGELAVNGTVNDLAMCGAIPKYLSLSFIIEEGLKMEHFWKILVSIKIAAEKAGVFIVTGDTKVVDKGKADKIFINTSGIGEMNLNASIGVENVKAGDKIIISGNIASHGMAIISVRSGLEFEADIVSDTRGLGKVVNMLLDDFKEDIHFLRDPTRGGVATVLNEMASDSKLGVHLNYSDLPFSESVEGACEMLGLDPLYVANEGLFLSVVSPDIADDFIEKLRNTEEGRDAAIIGTITEENPGRVICTSPIGGKRVLSMLAGEQLPRIC